MSDLNIRQIDALIEFYGTGKIQTSLGCTIQFKDLTEEQLEKASKSDNRYYSLFASRLKELREEKKKFNI